MNADSGLNWTADSSTTDDRSKAGMTIAGAGPVPRTTGILVIGAIIGLSVIKRVFRGA